MFQTAWVIFRGLNASAWLKLLLITIYENYVKMIKKLLLHITRVISAGWCAECWLGGA
jgi:hypothetical protein